MHGNPWARTRPALSASTGRTLRRAVLIARNACSTWDRLLQASTAVENEPSGSIPLVPVYWRQQGHGR